MNSASAAYPIGTPGTPWGDAERAEWLSRQTRQRSYESDVLSGVERLRSRFNVEEPSGIWAGRLSWQSAAATGVPIGRWC